MSSHFLTCTGVDPGKIMAELCMKDGGTCRGAGGSMHIYVSVEHPADFTKRFRSNISKARILLNLSLKHRINQQDSKAVGHWWQSNSLTVPVQQRAFC